MRAATACSAQSEASSYLLTATKTALRKLSKARWHHALALGCCDGICFKQHAQSVPSCSGAGDVSLAQADLQAKMRTLSLDTAGTKEALVERVLKLRAQAPEQATEVNAGREDDLFKVRYVVNAGKLAESPCLQHRRAGQTSKLRTSASWTLLAPSTGPQSSG